jgi:hypothetical protein
MVLVRVWRLPGVELPQKFKGQPKAGKRPTETHGNPKNLEKT